MLTIRPLGRDGSWGAKSYKEYILDDNGERIRLASGEYKSRKVYTVDWNDQNKAELWREGWANMLNRYLEQNGIDERVDHKSYERQGLDILPTVHMGVAASQMEKKGISTDKGNHNREVASMNSELRQTMARIKKQKSWLYAQPLVDAPSIIDTFGAAANSHNLNTNWQRIKNLQSSAKVLIFLSNNGISDFSQLMDKVTQLHSDFQDMSANIKKMERRINTLSTHLAQWEVYQKHNAVYKEYKSLPSKKQDGFYDKHEGEIQLYRDSKAYFDKVMNGRKELPIQEWQTEKKTLLSERFVLVEQYYKIKEDVRSVELLQRGAEKLIKEAASEIAPTKNREMVI